MPRNTQVTIDPKAIEHNLKCVRSWASGANIMAVVKADAYGHRIDLCLPALKAADLLAVATLEEARAIRRLGSDQSIVLLEGVSHATDLAVAEELGLELVIHSRYQLEMLQQRGRAPARRLWLKINTGMNRLGVSPDEVQTLYAALEALPGVDEVCLMSHFASAGEDNAFTQQQMASFEKVTQGLSGGRCLTNSAGLLKASEAKYEWVRAGIVLYGISPLKDQSAQALGLKPAMTVEAELIAINTVEAGEGIGYGQRFVASQRMLIGVASIGYGDGYPRAMQDGAPVLINGQRARLVGRVSMDMITVDLSNVVNPAIGDPVRLWGEGLPAEEVALWADTIPYELVCRMTRRVRYNMAP